MELYNTEKTIHDINTPKPKWKVLIRPLPSDIGIKKFIANPNVSKAFANAKFREETKGKNESTKTARQASNASRIKAAEKVICLKFLYFQSGNGSRHRAAREKLTIRKRVDAAPVHGMVTRSIGVRRQRTARHRSGLGLRQEPRDRHRSAVRQA